MAKKKAVPQTDSPSMPGLQRDDALFETLGKNKKRKRRRILMTVVSILLVLAIIAVAGVSFLQRRVRKQFAASQGEVLSYSVTTGSISTVVSGSGSLTDVDLEAITVPEGVEITDVLVKAKIQTQERKYSLQKHLSFRCNHFWLSCTNYSPFYSRL